MFWRNRWKWKKNLPIDWHTGQNGVSKTPKMISKWEKGTNTLYLPPPNQNEHFFKNSDTCFITPLSLQTSCLYVKLSWIFEYLELFHWWHWRVRVDLCVSILCLQIFAKFFQPFLMKNWTKQWINLKQIHYQIYTRQQSSRFWISPIIHDRKFS